MSESISCPSSSSVDNRHSSSSSVHTPAQTTASRGAASLQVIIVGGVTKQGASGYFKTDQTLNNPTYQYYNPANE